MTLISGAGSDGGNNALVRAHSPVSSLVQCLSSTTDYSFLQGIQTQNLNLTTDYTDFTDKAGVKSYPEPSFFLYGQWVPIRVIRGFRMRTDGNFAFTGRGGQGE